ncbi:MAG: hypothetical protein ACE5LF_08805 [Alphaproteobacteria bacterium]
MRTTLLTTAVASLALFATAFAAAAAGTQSTPTASPSPQPAMSKPLWDSVARKKASPYYQMEAYLKLKPRREVGDLFAVPALLANGKCSDPAGEGR